MENYPQELVQVAVSQGHTGHMTGLWFLPRPAEPKMILALSVSTEDCCD